MTSEERSEVTTAAWEKMKAGSGYIYAAQLPDGVIKIGFALNPHRRAREMKGKIIATIKGTREQELALHKRLAPFMIANYGGRPEATEFYVPAVLTHGLVPAAFRKGTQVHPGPKRPGRRKRHDDEVIALHDGGRLTLQEVGRKLGLTKQRVAQILAKNKITVRKGVEARIPVKVYRERVERYKAALKPGVRSKDALAAAGLTYTELLSAANALGIKLPKVVRSERLRYREIADYYTAHPDLTGVEVAAHFNVSTMTVSHALKVTGTFSRQSGWRRKRLADHQASQASA